MTRADGLCFEMIRSYLCVVLYCNTNVTSPISLEGVTTQNYNPWMSISRFSVFHAVL